MKRGGQRNSKIVDWKEAHWELLVAVLLVMGTVLGVTIPLHIQSRNEMIQSRSEMIQINERIEDQITAQNARTDRLYEMFIDLLKKSS